MFQRRSISVPVDGGELSVEVTGPLSVVGSPAVILLHDLASNGVVWRLVTSRLDQRVAAFAIDARGRSASAALPEPFGLAAHVADAVAVLDHFAVRSCVVVGHGTGGFTACKLATLHPDRVDGVVLVNGGLPITVTGDPRAAIDASLLPVLGRLRTFYVDRDAALLDARRAMAPGLADSVFTESQLHDLGGQPPQVRSRTNEAAVWFDGSELVLDPAASSSIHAVDAPIEVLRADGEPERFDQGNVTPTDPADLERRLLQLSLVTVPGLDHDALVMHPQGADAVSRSITRVMARSAERVGWRPSDEPM